MSELVEFHDQFCQVAESESPYTSASAAEADGLALVTANTEVAKATTTAAPMNRTDRLTRLDPTRTYIAPFSLIARPKFHRKLP